MSEKNIFVTKSSMPNMEEYINEIASLWDSHILTNMGEKHERLQKELEEYLSVDTVSLFANGHMALELALQALQLKGEVITTPFTFASTTHAIVRNGLKPVFCDINDRDYTIDCSKIESLITDKTCAILPVHVYGNVCDVERLDEIAKKYGLKVIYDAAHAFGVRYKGKGIGSFGDVSMFSFHATKVFNTIEGGALSFSDKDIELELYRLKNFGIRGPETVDAIGANAKMNEFQAAMGLCNLRHLEGELEKRKRVYTKYMDGLGGISGIRIPKEQENVQRNYAYFPIVIDEKEYGKNRDAVFEELKKHRINSRKYFYPLTNCFDCYEGYYEKNPTPTAKWIADRVLTLPMYASLEDEVISEICEIIKNLKN